jgi:hypothetical protein
VCVTGQLRILFAYVSTRVNEANKEADWADFIGESEVWGGVNGKWSKTGWGGGFLGRMKSSFDIVW